MNVMPPVVLPKSDKTRKRWRAIKKQVETIIRFGCDSSKYGWSNTNRW